MSFTWECSQRGSSSLGCQRVVYAFAVSPKDDGLPLNDFRPRAIGIVRQIGRHPFDWHLFSYFRYHQRRHPVRLNLERRICLIRARCKQYIITATTDKGIVTLATSQHIVALILFDEVILRVKRILLNQPERSENSYLSRCGWTSLMAEFF